MSDEHPADEPVDAAPAWATLPTMPRAPVTRRRSQGPDSGIAPAQPAEPYDDEPRNLPPRSSPGPGRPPRLPGEGFPDTSGQGPRGAGPGSRRAGPGQYPEQGPPPGQGPRGSAQAPYPGRDPRDGAHGPYPGEAPRGAAQVRYPGEGPRRGPGPPPDGSRYRPSDEPGGPADPPRQPGPPGRYDALHPADAPSRGQSWGTHPPAPPGISRRPGQPAAPTGALAPPFPARTGAPPIGAPGIPAPRNPVSRTEQLLPDEAAQYPPNGTALPEPAASAGPSGPDPEVVLTAYEWRFDPETLREVVVDEEIDELEEIRELLTVKVNETSDNRARARLLSLRAVVSRILGDLNKAQADAKLALAHAEATGELRRVAIAQARYAHVLQWRGEFAEADRLFAQASSTELPDRLRATIHQHAGKSAYDQGRYIEACNHFEQALQLRKEEDPGLIALTELALDAVFRKVAERGWGPYPRRKDDILQSRPPLAPTFDERSQRWGYTDDAGVFRVPPRYADAQPFRDGAAWVQHLGTQNWALIDDGGRLLIDPAAGYLGVGSFSEGIAWVSRDGIAGWIGIDRTNAVLISTGFDDVRPFRRGLATVRRGRGWGAVDGVGRTVVPLQYDAIATSLHDGRYIDGFSDEGLAGLSAGGRKGVVDRSGRVIVPPSYPVLVIHPVAFLIADTKQRWGALDRHGGPLLSPSYLSRNALTDELDRLLVDTRLVI